jgi:hypothetical protein
MIFRLPWPIKDIIVFYFFDLILKITFMKIIITFLVVPLFFFTCTLKKEGPVPSKVEIKKEGDRYKMYRNGESYFIKGAVGWSFLDELKASGGNSLRTSAIHLDEAYERGLTALVNIPMKAERDGFDYNDESAVKEQFEKAKAIVEEYKDHPALLMWAIGNELDHIPGDLDYNLKMWDAVNDIAGMIKEIDPNHPIMSVTGFGKLEKLNDIKERCPKLDLLGINAYASLVKVPDWLSEYNWDKPFAVTEWGPSGWWEVPRTKWGVVIEETSTEKAEVYRERYEKVILGDPRCIGSYVFLWTTNRQERTHTWFNMFHDSLKTQTVEVMQYMWTNTFPDNFAPHIESLTINGNRAIDHVHLAPGETGHAQISVNDPDSDELSLKWELLPEPTEFGAYAGQGETKPKPVDGFIINKYNDGIDFQVPSDQPVNYRLFVYVYDGQGHVAVANIPFYVSIN